MVETRRSGDRRRSNNPRDRRRVRQGGASGGCLDSEDVMEAARSLEGIASVKDIKFAILEVSGNISIVRKS